VSAEWARRCLIARVRVLALRGQALAGGVATGVQLARAIAPIADGPRARSRVRGRVGTTVFSGLGQGMSPDEIGLGMGQAKP